MNFNEVIAAAINDFLEHGFDGMDRVERWVERIKIAARRALISETVLTDTLNRTFQTIYKNEIDKGGIIRRYPDIPRFTVDRMRPELRLLLDHRLAACAGLIKNNRDAAIARTAMRFTGWATSIPAGGTDAASRREIRKHVGKSLKQLPFEERRVVIDQGHKFTANLNHVVAVGAGAIAMVWHSHWRQRGYNYRKDHRERDDLVYAIRDSWAIERGLINKGAGYLDEITQPGEEVFCRCFGQYVFNLRDLPIVMLSQKGKDELERVRAAIAEMSK